MGNQPNRFVDPEGKVINIALGAIIGGVAGGVSAYISNPNLTAGQIAQAAAIGAGAGALTATGLGGIAGSLVVNRSLLL